MSTRLSICTGIFFALANLCPSGIDAQRFQNLNDIIPMALSEVLFQDSEGYLWIGTINGLVRFDGYDMRYFAHDPNDSTSIAGNNINSIGEDQQGRIWVGMSSFGLDILDRELEGFQHVCIPDTDGVCMQDISVNSFAPEGDSIMWVGTEKGLMQYSIGRHPELIRRFDRDSLDPMSLSSSYVIKVFLDGKDRLWVGTHYGLNLLDRQTGEFVNSAVNASFPSTQILWVTEDRNGGIWVSPRFTEERLLQYDTSSGTFVPFPGFYGTRFGEFKMTFDLQNNLWISSRGVGVYYIDAVTGKQTFYDPKKPALHGYRNIYGLQPLCDRYGNIWIAGAQVMEWPATHKVIEQIYVGEGPIIAVFGNQNGIWFCDDEPRRFYYHTGRVETYWPPDLPGTVENRSVDPATRKVYCIQPYDDQRVIMTATRNVLIWNLATDQYTDYPLNYGGPFRDFVITRDHRHIWICGNQGIPIYFDLITGRDERPAYLQDIRSPYCVAQSPNGDLWFGSFSDGVYHVDAQTHAVENFRPDAPDPAHRLSDFSVNDIAVTKDGIVWVGTNLGVNRIDPVMHEIAYLRKQPEFKNESVMSVLPDADGKMWFGTQNGLVRYDPATGKFASLNKTDGLVNVVYSLGACHRDSRGYLYFAGDRGIDIVDPRRIGKNMIPPDLFISNILVNNEIADSAMAPEHVRALTLTHKENFIEVELLALQLTAPLANTYAYRIPELDTTWRALGTRRNITLAHLQPGHYTLQARAANADGIWSPDKTMLHITIRPPFWLTWWFITCLAAMAAGLIYMIYRYRVHQIQEREKLRTEFNKRIAEMESRALRAQMNPHFLFNSLNSVKSLISQGENDKATQYLTRFGQLIRQVLSNSERPFVRLQEELEALRLYLEIEQLRFQNFEYTVTVGKTVNADFIEVPPLILQPYVENAIWHGLMHKEIGERTVLVDVRRTNGFLTMTIEDNGIGRERSDQIKMRGNTRKGGMGMRLTSDRLNLLHRIYGSDVSITVEDLHDTSGKPTGTRVQIRIPYVE